MSGCNSDTPQTSYPILEEAGQMSGDEVQAHEESERVILIVTGRYGQGTAESNEMVASILGRENSQEYGYAIFYGSL